MICNFCICICLALIPAAVRAGNKPHGAADSQTINLWTNSDLDRVDDVAPVSIVGQVDQVKSTFESGTRVYEATQDPDWYARYAENGKPIANPVWLDTVTVAYGETVDVVMDFTNPVIKGMSVFHCHLLNHEDKGMMAKILFE